MRYKYNEIDLHIHTVDSDGKCTGRQIIEKAHEKGIIIFSQSIAKSKSWLKNMK